MVTYLKAELYDFSYLQQNAFDKEDAYCPLSRQVSLFGLIKMVFLKDFVFHSHDEARQYFLNLQNKIKNMNFLPFNSDEYRNTYKEIVDMIHKGKIKGKEEV